MMREELDSILVFISEATLTDNEWSEIESMSPVTAKDKYQALYLILKKRSGEGDATTKLRAFFIAKGFIEIEDPKVEFNNISIGVVLE